MCSKRFLNSPPLYSKNVWVLVLSCPSQRLQGSGPLCALMFLSMVDGCGLPHPWVSLLQSPVRGLVSWYKCETIFLFGILFSIFTFRALSTWRSFLLREGIFIFFSFCLLPWRWLGTSVEGSYKVIASRWWNNLLLLSAGCHHRHC